MNINIFTLNYMMRPFKLIIGLTTLLLRLNAQVGMQTNLPDSIASSSELTFEVKINKGDISNFAKYQLDVPEGLVVEEVDSRTGSFSYENKRAKIVWVIAPPDSEFVIKMKLISGPLTGQSEFRQKFYYIENGNRKEAEAKAQKVVLYKTRKVSAETKVTEPKKVAENKTDPAPVKKAATVAAPVKQNPQNINAVQQQSLQFRADSKKAYELASKEKSDAEKSLAEANAAIARAETISDETEKKKVLDEANNLKEKAEMNNITASKILELSKVLEESAVELELANGITYTNSTQPVSSKKQSGNNQDANTTFSLSSENAEGQANYESKKIDKLSPKETMELKQQAEQFRKDAKDASEIGLREKEIANTKLQEAEDMRKNAEFIKDEAERKSVEDKAEKLRQKAENDVQTAEKIILLSKTLEENANEIDKLVAYVNPDLAATTVTNQSTEDSPPLAPTVKEESSKAETEKTIKSETIEASTDLVYMIQIGAFTKSPDVKAFKGLGKYKIVNEDNKYKVLLGSYASREAAAQRRTEIFSMGFDGFVVSYKNGVRVK